MGVAHKDWWRPKPIFIPVKFLCIIVIVLCSCQSQPTQQAALKKDSTYTEAPELIQPTKLEYLTDSTRVWYLQQAEIQPDPSFPQKRTLTVSGDLFMETKPGAPLLIHTHLLNLHISGGAAFLLSAPKKDPWAEIKLLRGQIIAQKNYSSPYPEPDTMQANQLLMINRDVDIMEKEDDSFIALKAWRKAHP